MTESCPNSSQQWILLSLPSQNGSYNLDIYNASTGNALRVQSGSGNGSLVLTLGISGYLWYIQFLNSSGTLVSYIGYANLANYIDLYSVNGYLGYRANSNFIVASQLGVGGNTLNSGTALTVTGNSAITCNVGIGTVYSSTYNLNVYGVSYFEPKQGGVPSTGAIGSDGMAIVIYPGTSSSQCMTLGFGNSQLWYNTPSGNFHNFYVAGTLVLTVSSSGIKRLYAITRNSKL